jgi:hypothetical protein
MVFMLPKTSLPDPSFPGVVVAEQKDDDCGESDHPGDDRKRHERRLHQS